MTDLSTHLKKRPLSYAEILTSSNSDVRECEQESNIPLTPRPLHPLQQQQQFSSSSSPATTLPRTAGRTKNFSGGGRGGDSSNNHRQHAGPFQTRIHRDNPKFHSFPRPAMRLTPDQQSSRPPRLQRRQEVAAGGRDVKSAVSFDHDGCGEEDGAADFGHLYPSTNSNVGTATASHSIWQAGVQCPTFAEVLRIRAEAEQRSKMQTTVAEESEVEVAKNLQQAPQRKIPTGFGAFCSVDYEEMDAEIDHSMEQIDSKDLGRSYLAKQDKHYLTDAGSKTSTLEKGFTTDGSCRSVEKHEEEDDEKDAESAELLHPRIPGMTFRTEKAVERKKSPRKKKKKQNDPVEKAEDIKQKRKEEEELRRMFFQQPKVTPASPALPRAVKNQSGSVAVKQVPIQAIASEIKPEEKKVNVAAAVEEEPIERPIRRRKSKGSKKKGQPQPQHESALVPKRASREFKDEITSIKRRSLKKFQPEQGNEPYVMRMRNMPLATAESFPKVEKEVLRSSLSRKEPGRNSKKVKVVEEVQKKQEVDDNPEYHRGMSLDVIAKYLEDLEKDDFEFVPPGIIDDKKSHPAPPVIPVLLQTAEEKGGVSTDVENASSTTQASSKKSRPDKKGKKRAAEDKTAKPGSTDKAAVAKAKPPSKVQDAPAGDATLSKDETDVKLTLHVEKKMKNDASIAKPPKENLVQSVPKKSYEMQDELSSSWMDSEFVPFDDNEEEEVPVARGDVKHNLTSDVSMSHPPQPKSTSSDLSKNDVKKVAKEELGVVDVVQKKSYEMQDELSSAWMDVEFVPFDDSEEVPVAIADIKGNLPSDVAPSNLQQPKSTSSHLQKNDTKKMAKEELGAADVVQKKSYEMQDDMSCAWMDIGSIPLDDSDDELDEKMTDAAANNASVATTKKYFIPAEHIDKVDPYRKEDGTNVRKPTFADMCKIPVLSSDTKDELPPQARRQETVPLIVEVQEGKMERNVLVDSDGFLTVVKRKRQHSTSDDHAETGVEKSPAKETTLDNLLSDPPPGSGGQKVEGQPNNLNAVVRDQAEVDTKKEGQKSYEMLDDMSSAWMDDNFVAFDDSDDDKEHNSATTNAEEENIYIASQKGGDKKSVLEKPQKKKSEQSKREVKGSSSTIKSIQTLTPPKETNKKIADSSEATAKKTTQQTTEDLSITLSPSWLRKSQGGNKRKEEKEVEEMGKKKKAEEIDVEGSVFGMSKSRKRLENRVSSVSSLDESQGRNTGEDEESTSSVYWRIKDKVKKKRRRPKTSDLQSSSSESSCGEEAAEDAATTTIPEKVDDNSPKKQQLETQLCSSARKEEKTSYELGKNESPANECLKSSWATVASREPAKSAATDAAHNKTPSFKDIKLPMIVVAEDEKTLAEEKGKEDADDQGFRQVKSKRGKRLSERTSFCEQDNEIQKDDLPLPNAPLEIHKTEEDPMEGLRHLHSEREWATYQRLQDAEVRYTMSKKESILEEKMTGASHVVDQSSDAVLRQGSAVKENKVRSKIINPMYPIEGVSDKKEIMPEIMTPNKISEAVNNSQTGISSASAVNSTPATSVVQGNDNSDLDFEIVTLESAIVPVPENDKPVADPNHPIPGAEPGSQLRSENEDEDFRIRASKSRFVPVAKGNEPPDEPKKEQHQLPVNTGADSLWLNRLKCNEAEKKLEAKQLQDAVSAQQRQFDGRGSVHIFSEGGVSRKSHLQETLLRIEADVSGIEDALSNLLEEEIDTQWAITTMSLNALNLLDKEANIFEFASVRDEIALLRAEAEQHKNRIQSYLAERRKRNQDVKKYQSLVLDLEHWLMEVQGQLGAAIKLAAIQTISDSIQVQEALTKEMLKKELDVEVLLGSCSNLETFADVKDAAGQLQEQLDSMLLVMRSVRLFIEERQNPLNREIDLYLA